jgi:hypothetical protein
VGIISCNISGRAFSGVETLEGSDMFVKPASFLTIKTISKLVLQHQSEGCGALEHDNGGLSVLLGFQGQPAIGDFTLLNKLLKKGVILQHDEGPVASWS